MELICLIKCLTELAFRVQREFKQEGRDEILYSLYRGGKTGRLSGRRKSSKKD